ncbi:hypothetical protein ACNQR9_09505 [Mycolicibacterium peregrinum]
MTNICQHCSAETPGNLCSPCTGLLIEMLEELPDLMEELDVTRLAQDKIVSGSVGKRPGGRQWPIRVGVMKLVIEVDRLMVEWTGRISEKHRVQFFPALSVGEAFVGPLLPGWKRLPKGYCGSAGQRARWLVHHIRLVVNDEKVGDLYNRLCDLVGDPDHPSVSGRLVAATDRITRVFAGLCPTTRTWTREGKPIECGTSLWAADDQPEVECPRCEQSCNVKENRVRMLTDRDLMAEPQLLEMMANLGEPVGRNKFLGWVATKKVHIRGYIHNHAIVPKQVRKTDPRVYSLSQVRAVREAEESKKVPA